MTRVATYPIGDWVSQDDRVTSVDHYLNVHDYQRWGRNWNCVLARCLRAPVWSTLPGSATLLFGIEPVTTTSVGDAMGPFIIPVPRYCQTMTLYVRANANDADTDLFIYPLAIGGGGLSIPGLVDSNYRIQITGTSEADYSCTVRVDEIARQQGFGLFMFTYIGEIDVGEGVKQALNILDAGPDWVVADASPVLPGRVLTFPTDPSIGRQIGVGYNQVTIDADTGYRISVARPWAKVPTVADTIDTYEVGTAVVKSMVLFPNRVSSFSNSDPEL